MRSFTRHAATVTRAVERFDEEFVTYLNGTPPEDSCARVLEELEAIRNGAVERPS